MASIAIVQCACRVAYNGKDTDEAQATRWTSTSGAPRTELRRLHRHGEGRVVKHLRTSRHDVGPRPGARLAQGHACPVDVVEAVQPYPAPGLIELADADAPLFGMPGAAEAVARLRGVGRLFEHGEHRG